MFIGVERSLSDFRSLTNVRDICLQKLPRKIHPSSHSSNRSVHFQSLCNARSIYASLSAMQGLPELGLANILPLKHFRNVGLDQPPSPPMKFWTDFGTLDLSWSGQPSPPMKIWTDLGILKLSWSGLHPLPSKNEHLDRSWHLGSELVWSTPPPTYVGAGVRRLIAVSPKYTVFVIIINFQKIKCSIHISVCLKFLLLQNSRLVLLQSGRLFRSLKVCEGNFAGGANYRNNQNISGDGSKANKKRFMLQNVIRIYLCTTGKRISNVQGNATSCFIGSSRPV